MSLNLNAVISLQQRYRIMCYNGTPKLIALLACIFYVFFCCFFRLESASWRIVLANHSKNFPHISILRPRLGDLVRYIIQIVYLLLVKSVPQKTFWLSVKQLLTNFRAIALKKLQLMRALLVQCASFFSRNKKFVRLNSLLPRGISRPKRLIDFLSSMRQSTIFHYCKRRMMTNSAQRRLMSLKKWSLNFAIFFLGFISLWALMQPLSDSGQFTLFIVFYATALIIRRFDGNGINILLALLSSVMSIRYIWWRCSYTLHWHDWLSTVFGSLLLFAELYCWLVLILSFIQSSWPLHRKPVALPKDTKQWPVIDIFIATYNEDLSIVAPTVYACLAMDWPKGQLNIYILDDGRRASFKAFAEEVGVHYIGRPTNEHAKAGNINYALQHSKGELIAIFDCDHLPCRSFLQFTVGWFLKDKDIAFLQTPHHFYSLDSFQRNLHTTLDVPSENALFYGVIQDCNDTWNATFFCGSCGIIRRNSLQEIGGFAVDSVTEDAYTSIKLHKKGYSSAYIPIPLAAGLATESISSHIGQRIRWARGMIQILRMDNPLFKKGLSIFQRLCYFSAMLHFLFGIPRLIFFLSPLAYLVLYAKVITASATSIFLYVMSFYVINIIANSKIQGKFRHFLWNDVYETVLAWYIAWPTLLALINPRVGRFNVTAKGGLIEKGFLDLDIAPPYLTLCFLSYSGLCFGLYRLIFDREEQFYQVSIAMLWVIYNLLLLLSALGTSVEKKQIRHTHRVSCSFVAAVRHSNGHVISARMVNYSSGGACVYFDQDNIFVNGEQAELFLQCNQDEFVFPITFKDVSGLRAGFSLELSSHEQKINWVRATFSRSDNWALSQKEFRQDLPLKSLLSVFRLGLKSHVQVYHYLSLYLPINGTLAFCSQGVQWFLSFAPRSVKCDP